MANISIKILGDKELSDKLERLKDNVQKTIVKDALKEAAEFIKLYAVMLAPRYTGPARKGVTPGIMANSIYVKVIEGYKGKIGFKVETGARNVLGIDPKDPYYYPAAVEFGTDKMSARPFLRPAVYDNEGQLLIMIGDKISKGIDAALASGKKQKGY